MQFLKVSTAATIKLGPFLDETDGKTAETALTISQADVRLSKNGGDMAQKNDATSATHDELGYYDVPLSTTDTNTVGRLQVMVSESGALPVWAEFMVLPAMIYDSLVAGTDRLDANVTHVLDTAQTAGDLAALVATLTTYVDTEMAATLAAALAVKAKTDNLPASPAAVGSAMTLDDAEDVYYVEVSLEFDDSNNADEYVVAFVVNGAPIATASVTSPTITVVKASDGSTIINAQTLTAIAGTKRFKFNTTSAGQRLSAGDVAIVQLSATVGGGSRSFEIVRKRDAV